MSKIVKPWPPSPPPLKTLYADADALADIPARLSADTLLQWTHTTGQAVDDLTPTASPLNPGSSSYGHDHSGGAFGEPLFRSVVAMSFAHLDHLGLDGTRLGGLQLAQGSWKSPPIPVHIPGCPAGGAYDSMRCRALIYYEKSSINPTDSNDTLTLSVGRRVGDQVFSIETDGGDLNITGWRYVDWADPLGFTPGEVNVIQLQTHMLIDTAASGSHFGTTTWHSIEIGVAG